MSLQDNSRAFVIGVRTFCLSFKLNIYLAAHQSFKQFLIFEMSPFHICNSKRTYKSAKIKQIVYSKFFSTKHQNWIRKCRILMNENEFKENEDEEGDDGFQN